MQNSDDDEWFNDNDDNDDDECIVVIIPNWYINYQLLIIDQYWYRYNLVSFLLMKQ